MELTEPVHIFFIQFGEAVLQYLFNSVPSFQGQGNVAVFVVFGFAAVGSGVYQLVGKQDSLSFNGVDFRLKLQPRRVVGFARDGCGYGGWFPVGIDGQGGQTSQASEILIGVESGARSQGGGEIDESAGRTAVMADKTEVCKRKCGSVIT